MLIITIRLASSDNFAFQNIKGSDHFPFLHEVLQQNRLQAVSSPEGSNQEPARIDKKRRNPAQNAVRKYATLNFLFLSARDVRSLQ
ncbi:MAG: hypothetical protein IT559_07880 [Alphaproteobacteria bacterium]|nr:hypothetical protein [Alphaproteobacteria bacterium]